MLAPLVRKNFKLIDKNEGISRIFGYLYEDRFFPVITDGKKPWGIVDVRHLLKRKLSINEKIKDFVVGIPKVDASCSIRKARGVMLKSGQPYLFVNYEGEFIGYITAIDIAISTGNKKARKIMRKIKPCGENESVASVISKMRKSGSSVLPVVENDRFIGVVRARDLIKIATTHQKRMDYHPEKTTPLEMPVKGIIDRSVRTVTPESDELVKIVDKQGFAIACDDEKYVGLIELIDLIK